MASESIHPASAPSRRVVVAAVGAAGLALTLNACGSEDDPSPAASDAGEDTAAGAGGSVLAKTSDIPEGGGKIFKDSGVVVTQPTAGQFKAFSSKCTHQGCAVTGITDGVITCPCHKSEFSVADGSVKKGPATQPLPEEKITVSGDSITLA
ncbi:Rieske Fe-S protein [Streptomyces sp. SAI-208]|jgi:Rieske Fe-S protein|uniref:Rieske (2Fe-2S) protein n=1 Tax=unclassified Streptomyces TaxID=2593676 RepID=UPI0024754E1E|nr:MULTISPECIES: Rieske (2Fe-2S) protein [unclassified Streptomyces]MDH6520580.1 Rieske Fe-S protein [Streptomyces sp. SAI-090]MDH6552797.1 Rieske Fe-S protein [Streptomyces sp. SAI-041]MDH6571884.1 Rieske Fe-S protein [Streptomyces sp. SAI-117]MDH6583157.1 Rieske Fe-S protein [Streptomyces sp. SAI-133]MDH6611564.1 Rieske Fe-S protein [Streptomyces sp. SAI-208]